MDIVVYKRDNEINLKKGLSNKVTHAFIQGLRNLNLDVEVRRESDYRISDVAVIFGQYKSVFHKKTLPKKRIYDKHPIKRLITLEVGFIRRKEFFHVGIGGINGRAYFPLGNINPERFNMLEREMKPWHGGDYILLTGQVPWDSTVQHVNYKQWVHDIVVKIREYTDRPIHWRPHPLQKKAVNVTEEFRELYGVKNSTGSLQEALAEAHACVTFCSNSSVDAVLAGTPVFVSDRNAITYPIANKDISLIEHPLLIPREKFLNKLAHCQWSVQEMIDGVFWPEYKRYFERLL